jgi:Rieske 2Fe-2S family protein
MGIVENWSGSKAAALIERRKVGYSLEAPFYKSTDIFDLDMAAIFARHWIHVGVEADIPEAGNFVTVDFANYAIILLRDNDLQLRAFHNVCRHRGSRIFQEAKGSSGRIVCKYHKWTYDLTGPLINAEHMAPDVSRASLGLKPIHIRSLGGLLFVCLAEMPPEDFEDMRAAVDPYLDPHDLANCKVVAQTDIIEDGNWKIVMENNRECYHCGGHTELLRTFFQFFAHTEADVKPRQREYYERYLRIQGEMRDIWNSCGLPSALVDRLDDQATAFRLERLALDNAGESYTLDTKIASRRLLGSFIEPRLGALSLHTQPNSWNHFLSDHAVIFSVLPLSADKTLLRTKWLVHKEAVEGSDYDLENLTKVWLRTNEQDATFVGWQSAGANSPAYEPGPFSPNENQLEKFYGWYTDRLRDYLQMPARPTGG